MMNLGMMLYSGGEWLAEYSNGGLSDLNTKLRKWAPNEPNNYKNRGENCSTLRHQYDFLMNDESCTLREFPFICRYKK